QHPPRERSITIGWKLIGPLTAVAIVALTSLPPPPTRLLGDDGMNPPPALTPPNTRSAPHSHRTTQGIRAAPAPAGPGTPAPPLPAAPPVEPLVSTDGTTRIPHDPYSGGGLYNFPYDGVAWPGNTNIPDNSSFSSAAVPEPTTLWLLCSALVGVALASS